MEDSTPRASVALAIGTCVIVFVSLSDGAGGGPGRSSEESEEVL